MKIPILTLSAEAEPNLNHKFRSFYIKTTLYRNYNGIIMNNIKTCNEQLNLNSFD